MLSQGRDIPSIATALNLSDNTVWTYVKKIYRATGVHSRQELIDLILVEKD